MKSMKTAVQRQLRDYVKSTGIKQRFIANAIGAKEYTISDIFSERKEMRADEFLAICIALNKNPNDFVEGFKKEE